MYDLKLKSIFLKTMLNNDQEALLDRDNLTGDFKDAAKAKSIDRLSFIRDVKISET